jgi:hypothetical protein
MCLPGRIDPILVESCPTFAHPDRFCSAAGGEPGLSGSISADLSSRRGSHHAGPSSAIVKSHATEGVCGDIRNAELSRTPTSSTVPLCMYGPICGSCSCRFGPTAAVSIAAVLLQPTAVPASMIRRPGREGPSTANLTSHLLVKNSGHRFHLEISNCDLQRVGGIGIHGGIGLLPQIARPRLT